MAWTFYDANGNQAITQLGTLAITRGGTGATDAATARTNLGVGTGSSPSFVNVTATTAFLPDANGATLGSASLEFSNLFLGDGAVINLGADQDVTLTHVADAGLLLNSDNYITFRDNALKIYSSADGQLDIDADTEVEITATNIDINGAVAFDGAVSGITTFANTGTTTFNSVAYTWPSAVAGTAGDMLTSATNGTLSWTTPSAGVGLGLVIALG